MAFTMMAGAAYTDQADITATEAVDMLNTLGVMTGDPDGKFRPNDTITRAEAARMIYSIRTNSDNADAYKSMQTTFKDVPADAWYAGYVKHCQAAGIVSGTSATTFEPSRDVTGVELALMCLRVMGYDPAKADIGGSTWSTKTVSLATEAGLLDGVNCTITAACPRQYAAQIMYNMIQANTVQWSDDKNGYSDQNLVGEDYDSVGVKYLKLYINVGTLTKVDNDNLTIEMSNSDKEDSDTTDLEFTKLSKDYTSLLGQKVKVLFRDKKTNDVIGVYPTEDSDSFTVALKDVEKDGDKVKFEGKSYSFDDGKKLDTQTVKPDGTIANESWTADKFDVDSNAAYGSAKNAVTPATVTFVDNDGDGKFNKAFVTYYDFAEVTYVGSDRITAGKTYKTEDENIAEGFEKDDYAVISYNRFDDCKDIVKADVVTAKLESSKDKGSYEQFEIDGTWYNVTEDEAKNVSVGDTVKAYVVGGVIVSIDTDDGTGAIPTNIAVLVGAGDDGNSLYGDQAKLRFFDGTLKTVTLSDKSAEISESDLGTAYKVSGAENNTKLEKLTKGNKYNGYYFNTKTDGKTELTGGVEAKKIKGEKVDDDAVVILYTENGNSKKITGKQFNNLAADKLKAYGSAFTKNVNGLCRVMLAAVKVEKTSISGTSYDNYGYIVEDGVKKASGDVQFTMWTGSENVEVLWENGNVNELVKGTLVAYASIDSDKYVQDGEVISTLKAIFDESDDKIDGNFYAGANKADSSKLISVGNDQLNVTADTHVLVLDTDADKAENIGLPYSYGDKLATATEIESGYLYNVVFRLEDGAEKADDKDLDLLVIDSTGSFDFNKPESTDDGKDDNNNVTTKDNVSIQGKEGLSIVTARVADKQAQVTLNIADQSLVNVSGTASVKVDGVSIASDKVTLKVVDHQLQIEVKDDYVTKDSKIVIDLSKVNLTK